MSLGFCTGSVRMKEGSKKSTPSVTDAFMHFYSEMGRVDAFFKLVIGLSEQVDLVRLGAARIKHEFEHGLQGAELEGRLEELKSTGAKNAVMAHKRLILELMTCRHIDNYLSYVSHILADIFRAKPETLRSNEQVRLDFVLAHESMPELVADIAERQVNKLSYQGMAELASYLKERIGLEAFRDESNMATVVSAIEKRNLIVHARGIVNKVYLKKVPAENYQVGTLLPLDPDMGKEIVEAMHESVRVIDAQAIQKFRVPKAKFAKTAKPSKSPKRRSTKPAKHKANQ